MIGHQHEQDTLNRHEYIRRMHEGQYQDYIAYLDHYKKKYFERV